MKTKGRENLDLVFKFVFKGTGFLTIALLAGIFFMLIFNSANFFNNVGLAAFFSGNHWDPESKYSVLPLLVSTFLVTLGSMLIAIPLGILSAAFLSEVASKNAKAILKPIIEMLAAVPSVATGFIGIVVVGPGLSNIFGLQNGLNALNGSILLAVMALPTIITISEDAINAVPLTHREASFALAIS